MKIKALAFLLCLADALAACGGSASPGQPLSTSLSTLSSPSASQPAAGQSSPTPAADQPPAPGSPCYNPSPAESLLPTPAIRPTRAPTAAGTAHPTATPAAPVYLSPRAGFGLSTAASPEAWAAELHAGWYVDWAVRGRGPDQLPEHWQMVRLKGACFYPGEAYLHWMASHYPGSIWIIGNEPDVIWQDNVTPEDYARQYGIVAAILRSADPTARLAPGGISQATPLRLAYLDRVLAAYKSQYGIALPADIWTVHGFVLREEKGSWGVEIPPGMDATQGELREVKDHDRLDLFQQQLTAFRAWMAKNGYRDTPLALTEFGILMPANYGFPPEKVASFLQDTFAWLQTARDPALGQPADDNRLVQRWAWFSLADSLYSAPDLADLAQGKLTPLGVAFRNYVMNNRP